MTTGSIWSTVMIPTAMCPEVAPFIQYIYIYKFLRGKWLIYCKLQTCNPIFPIWGVIQVLDPAIIQNWQWEILIVWSQISLFSWFGVWFEKKCRYSWYSLVKNMARFTTLKMDPKGRFFEKRRSVRGCKPFAPCVLGICWMKQCQC